MAQTNLNVRIDEDMKKDFERLCDDLGLSMTAAVCVYVKKAITEQRIPFDLNANDPFYTDTNMKRLMKSAEQMEQTGGTIHELGAIEDD